MTGRQRVLATLNRQPADCIPFDIGGTDCSAIHVITYRKLRSRLGLPDGPIRCGCLTQLVAEPDADASDALGVDVEALWFGSERTKIWRTPFGVDLIVPERFAVEDLPDGSSVVRDSKGAICAKRAADAYYYDPVGAPLAHVTSPAELERFDRLFARWDYSYVYDEPLDVLAQRARRQYEATDRAVVSLWRMHYLQAGMLMRGYQQFLMDLVTDKDLAHALLEQAPSGLPRRIEEFLRAFGPWLDIVFLTDDLGTQKGPMISPAVYREMIFPYISEAVGRMKAAGKKVVMHSCGAVAEFIPVLIEMGVDALNPVQVSARDMNPARAGPPVRQGHRLLGRRLRHATRPERV